MTWSDPRGNLRTFLNDDAQANLIKNKPVFPFPRGEADGTASTFFTFEDRIFCDEGPQDQSSSPLRIFIGSPYSQQVTEYPASGIVVTDAVGGEFTLMGAAPSGVLIKAQYYWQKWLDPDLDLYLQQAALQMNVSTASQVPDGLQLAALNLAGSMAHRQMAARWSFRKTMQFLLEDKPAAEHIEGLVAFHTEQAKELQVEGLAQRRAYYDLRMDQGRSPAYGLLARTPRPWTPRR